MESHRPRHSRRNPDKDLVTNTAWIMGAMDMLRDRSISPAFREYLHSIATEAVGKLAVIANENERFSTLKEQLAAVLEQSDKAAQAVPQETEEPPDRRKAA